MKIFISGGCKTGKSSYAERIAVALHERRGGCPLYYVATMLPKDGEDAARIERHRKSRAGLGFQTVEMPQDIVKLKSICDLQGVYLLDSVTAFLSNEMFPLRGGVAADAGEKTGCELMDIISAVQDIVIVSDYIYSDAVLYAELTECFRKNLAYLDRLCASACDAVIEVCSLSPVIYKGAEILDALGKEFNGRPGK